MKLELTIPPSTNNLFISFVRKGKQVRVKSDDYKAWQEENGWPVRASLPFEKCFGTIPVRIILTIKGGKGFPESSDIDNRLKAVLDLLKTCGVIAGDSVKYVREVRAVYLPPESKEDKASCYVEVFPVGAPIDSFARR